MKGFMLSQTNPENNQANVNYPHEKWRGKHSEGWQQLKTASTEGKTQTNQKHQLLSPIYQDFTPN